MGEQEQKKSKRGFNPFGVLAVVIAVAASVAVLVGGNYYLNNMKNALWEQSVMDTLETTSQGAHSFEVYLNKDSDTVATFADNLSQYNSTDEDLILNKLDVFTRSTRLFTVINLDGQVAYSSGVNEARPIEDEEIAELQQLSESGFQEPYFNLSTGQKMIGSYHRFTFADGVQGIVREGQLVNHLSEKFTISYYDGAGYSYVVNQEGDILIRPQTSEGNLTYVNIVDVVEYDGSNNQEDIEAFKDILSRSDKEAAMKLSLNGETFILTIVPMADTAQWNLVSIIPDSVVMSQANDILGASQGFVFIIGFALLLLCLLAIVLFNYRKRMRVQNKELVYQEQLFNMLVKNTDVVFLMLSCNDFNVEYVSPNIWRLMGITEEEAKNDIRNIGKVRYTDSADVTFDTLKAIKPGEMSAYFGEYIHKKTGDRRWVKSNVYRVEIDDSDRLIVLIFDRTEEHKAEQVLNDALKSAEAANASKSNFLSNMSHDIRTPMNAIVGLTTLLQRDAENPELVMEHARKITASSQHLLGLINDVLDMAKIESGKTTLTNSEIVLAEFVDELGTMMRPQAKAKGLKFDIKVFNVSVERIIGDKLRLNQILINILSNAVKYTPEGGNVVFEIHELGKSTKNFVNMRFLVRDDGIGMSQDYVKTMFDPFTREVNSVTNTVQGTGLGLAITKNLVDLMGGIIDVKSVEGEGSTFTVDLTFSVSTAEEDEKFFEDRGIRSALVVDDDKDACASVLTAMSGTGVEMQFALDGHTAVNMVTLAHSDGDDYNLVIIDWKMPGMDGLECAKHIREIVPDDVPIMILTAYDWSSVDKKQFEGNVDGFLPKPFFLSALKQLMVDLEREDEDDASEQSNKVDADIMLGGKNFLAAEDNMLSSGILVELLDMLGAKCTIVENGQKVLDAFLESEPGEYDAILMDVQMPVMNGYEATREIRASEHPCAKTIPIIAMTANAFADDVDDAMRAGMDAHMAKPVEMEKLAVVLRGIEEKRGEIRE